MNMFKSPVKDVSWTLNVVGPANTVPALSSVLVYIKKLYPHLTPCQYIACWCVTSNSFGKQHFQAEIEIEIVR